MRRSRALLVMVIALVAATATVGVAVAVDDPLSSSSARTTTLDLYMAGTNQSINVSQPPQPGEQNIIGSDLYVLGDDDAAPVPIGDVIGRRVAVCTVVTTSEAICSGILDLKDRGTLAVQLEVLLPGGNQGIAVTGGTGEFVGASGAITETMVPGRTADRVLRVELMDSGVS